MPKFPNIKIRYSCQQNTILIVYPWCTRNKTHYKTVLASLLSHCAFWGPVRLRMTHTKRTKPDCNTSRKKKPISTIRLRPTPCATFPPTTTWQKCARLTSRSRVSHPRIGSNKTVRTLVGTIPARLMDTIMCTEQRAYIDVKCRSGGGWYNGLHDMLLLQNRSADNRPAGVAVYPAHVWTHHRRR